MGIGADAGAGIGCVGLWVLVYTTTLTHAHKKTHTHRKHHDTRKNMTPLTKQTNTHAHKHPHADNCQHSPHEKQASNHKHKCKHTHTHQKQKQHTLEIAIGQKITHLLHSLVHDTRQIGQDHIIRNVCILEPTFEWSCPSHKSDASKPQAV